VTKRKKWKDVSMNEEETPSSLASIVAREGKGGSDLKKTPAELTGDRKEGEASTVHGEHAARSLPGAAEKHESSRHP